jgi:hypothetical protein
MAQGLARQFHGVKETAVASEQRTALKFHVQIRQSVFERFKFCSYHFFFIFIIYFIIITVKGLVQ